MADSKWISGLTPDMPAGQAALAVLDSRLKSVAKQLPLVLQDPTEDLEPVHQLRVGTRRTAAALKLFREVLPKGWFRNTRRTLRQIRQSAGAARDWDVFLNRLNSAKSLADHVQCREFLVGYALGQRAAAQESLLNQRIELELALADVLRTMPDLEELRGSASFASLAMDELPEILTDLSMALEGPLLTSEALHQVRINGKRVRYAVEVFASGVGESLKSEFYPKIEELQEILGLVQDGNVGQSRLRTLLQLLSVRDPELHALLRPGILAFSREFQAETTKSKRAFKGWFSQWRKDYSSQDWSAWLKQQVDQTPRPETGGSGSPSLSEPEGESSGETTRLPRPVGTSTRSRGKTSGSSRSSGRGG
jgi:CHAD domain-containing protein